MGALEMAMHMLPMWLLGLFMVMVAIRSDNKDILRIQPKSVFNWIKFLAVINALRFAFLYFMWSKTSHSFDAISWLPWETTTMVWWEDAAHTLPLILLARLIGTSKKTWPIHALSFLLIWAAFASGHLYQGVWSALCISMYIPYTLKLSKEKGLGTIMICHILYDMTTLLLIKGMLRFM